MDRYKRKLGKNCPGGIKCQCCRIRKRGRKKDRAWNRKARRAAKQSDKERHKNA